MSDTRPPITAGPMERAFKFLKRTSVSCGVVDEGVAAGADKGGVVLAGDAVADAALWGAAVGSSWAPTTAQIENKQAQQKRNRALMSRNLANSRRFAMREMRVSSQRL